MSHRKPTNYRDAKTALGWTGDTEVRGTVAVAEAGESDRNDPLARPRTRRQADPH